MKDRITKLTIIFLCITLFQLQVFSADKDNTKEKTDTKIEKTDTKAEKEEEETSQYEERKNIILYGLGDDILELITKLKNDEDDRFDQDLQKVFAETKIPAIRQNLFQYFAEKQNPCLKNDALIILENRYDYPKDTVSAAILYSRDLKLKEAKKLLRSIVEEEDSDYMTMAISALGKIGDSEDAIFLSEIFENNYFDDEKQSLILQQNIASALEELHDKAVWDFLIEIAEDTDENATIRARMASALGKIGDEKAIPVLCKLFEDKDPLLRTAAIKGLAAFKTEKASSVLLQGFKDTYYKVRLQAIKSAREEKRTEAVPYILYRAKKDPVAKVQYDAIEALSEFNDADANEWMIKAFEKAKTKQSIKMKIAYYMLKNNFETIYPSVKKKSLEAISDKKKKKVAIEIGKILSKIKNPGTAELAEAYMNHEDVFVKSIGLDMFKKNEYSELIPLVQKIAENKKNGALSRRAKHLLEKAGDKSENKKTETETKTE